jgi:hypothetical protein
VHVNVNSPTLKDEIRVYENVITIGNLVVFRKGFKNLKITQTAATGILKCKSDTCHQTEGMRCWPNCIRPKKLCICKLFYTYGCTHKKGVYLKFLLRLSFILINELQFHQNIHFFPLA